MNKVTLSERLLVLAKESGMPGRRRAAAVGMLALAKELVGAATPELNEKAEAVEKLATQFKDVHADLVKEINEAEKALKDKQDILKAYYKDWATKSGYKVVKAEMLNQAQRCMDIGETLESVADGMKVVRRDSEQESYKEKYNVLVSMLNEAELAKYSRILNTFFNKQITEMKTGLKVLDDDVKAWHKEAQAIADERGIKLPKASDRTAGLMDMVEAMGEAIGELVNTVRRFFSGLLDRVVSNGRELDELEAQVERITSSVKGAF